MAKFSRSSTAYKQDGSVVNANVPRFESNGVMVEEGTTNLLPTNIQNAVFLNSAGTFNLDSGFVNGATYNLSGQKCVYADDTSVDVRVTLRIVYTDNSVDTIQALNNQTKDGIFQPFSIKLTANSSKTIQKVGGWLGDYTTRNNAHTEVKNCQLEAKPYATSFHPTTRASESLTIPATALNATEGTIEFDWLYMVNNWSTYPRLFGWGTGTNDLQISSSSAGKLVAYCYVNNVMLANTGLTSTFTLGTKYRIALKWWGSILRLFVNGVPMADGVYSPPIGISNTDGVLGCRYDKLSGWADALFSNLRISNKARSDTELANTGALVVDEFTTYFLSMNGNLSATCHPVMLVQGQGQVLLSRVGRGTRSIKVQSSGQVKLKRSACYYPTIAVGTKGEVQLSRQGIGYRGMKVEGQGSFKIQEPNIEIYPEIREREATTNIIERESTTEVIGVPYAGDTIKIKGTFKSFEGVAADPASITLKIYDTINNLLTTINVTATNKISAGVYEVNYTIPVGYQALYYEWHCTQGDSPQVTMGKITVLKRGQA